VVDRSEDGPTVGSGPRWRGIDELARLVGTYCWLDGMVFTTTGRWATGSGELDPSLRVWCAATSRRHGALAGCWAERLPVRAGVERGALVQAPGPGDAFAKAADALGALTDIAAGVDVLAACVLPRTLAVYTAHLAQASPVSEAPVAEVLGRARQALAAEISEGSRLLAAHPGGPGASAAAAARAFEHAFAAAAVFPADRPS
jgi:hypothetical protein